MPWAMFSQIVLLLVLVWAITCSIIDTVMRNRSIHKTLMADIEKKSASSNIITGRADA
jgi:hypothetical protein